MEILGNFSNAKSETVALGVPLCLCVLSHNHSSEWHLLAYLNLDSSGLMHDSLKNTGQCVSRVALLVNTLFPTDGLLSFQCLKLQVAFVTQFQCVSSPHPPSSTD